MGEQALEAVAPHQEWQQDEEHQREKDPEQAKHERSYREGKGLARQDSRFKVGRPVLLLEESPDDRRQAPRPGRDGPS
jgi:hypothetical protein